MQKGKAWRTSHAFDFVLLRLDRMGALLLEKDSIEDYVEA